MLEREHFIACGKLVEFLDRYSNVLVRQIDGVEASVEEAIAELMQSISAISTETGKYKAEAEKVLEETYLAPSSDTRDLIDAVQSSIDDIIAGVREGREISSEPDDAEGTSMRRLAGRFSKHMESISTMDDDLNALLVSMMGALSTGDVIGQRIEHVSRSLRALNLGLAYVLVDVNARFTLPGIRKLIQDLLDYTERQYGSEEERVIHNAIFGSKAA